MKEKFFYDAHLNKFKFGRMPTNALDVPRLIKGKAYWKAYVTGAEKKKKTILVTEVDLNNLDIRSQRIIKQRFMALRRQGFKVYVVSQENITELNSDNAEKYFANGNNPSVSEVISEKKMIERVVKDLELSRDEIFIFNDSLLAEFVDYGDDDWLDKVPYHEIDLQDVSISSASLLRLLTKEGSHIESLNLAGCRNLATYKRNPQEKIDLTNLTELTLGEKSNFDEANQSPQFNLESLIDEETGFGVDTSLFLDILKSAPNLKKLKSSSDISFALREIESLPMLEELTFYDTHFNEMPNMAWFHLQKLRMLKIVNSSVPEIRDCNFKFLETLDLESVYISSDSFKNILKDTKFLKILRLSSCPGLQEAFDSFNFAVLENLEELDLSRTNIDDETLNKIIDAAPNLRKIFLRNCRSLTDKTLSNIKNKCKKLEVCEISSDFSVKNYLDFCAKEKAVREMMLSDNMLCDITENDINDRYESVESLIVWLAEEDFPYGDREIKVDFRVFGKLLKNIPNIRTLYLEADFFHAQESDFGFSLNSLETLILSGNINSWQLSAFLSRAPNVKSLRFDGNFLDPLEFNALLTLKNLENIDIFNSNINPDLIKEMIKRSKRPIELKYDSMDAYMMGVGTDADTSEGLDIGTSFKYGHRGYSSQKDLPGSASDIQGNLDADSIGRPGKGKGKGSQKGLPRSPSDDSEGILDAGGDADSMVSPDKANASEKGAPGRASDIQGTWNAYKEQRLDAETTLNSDKKFNVIKIFYAKDIHKDIPVNNYRMSLYNEFSVNTEPCDIKNAFTIKNKSTDLQLVDRPIEISEHDLYQQFNSLPGDSDHVFYGKQDLKLTTDWKPLASLSSNEIITKYHLDPPNDVEIQYSERDNQYYIRLNPINSDYAKETIVTAKIDFILEIPEKKSEALPPDVQKVVNYCSSFGVGELNLPKGNLLTGQDYLDALQKQKLGACRHRSLVFMAMMKKQFPKIPVRMVINECHAFAEVQYNGQWVSCQLGGYPAELEINEPNNPVEQNKKPTLADLLESALLEMHSDNRDSYFPIPQKAEPEHVETKIYMEHILSDSENNQPIKNTRINLPGAYIPGFRYHLEDYCESTGKPYYYIDSAEDLVCMASYLKRNLADNTGVIEGGETEEGKIVPAGPLYEFLKEHENDNTTPILIVNYDKFSSREIVSFNALLDKHEADGIPLPNAAKVIGLFDPNKPNAYEGEDFSSRFERRLDCPLLMDQLAIPAITQKSIIDVESHTIELYGGIDWEERMLGRWIMRGEDLFFVEGELLKILNKNKIEKTNIKNIELKNAPWHDENFVRFWHDAQRKGQFSFEGESYDLPMGLVLFASQGYAFHNLNLKVNESEHVSEDAIVVNPGTLFKLFGEYQCDSKNKTIQYGDGVLQKLAEQKIKNQKENKVNLYITDNLDISSWAQIVDACRDLNLAIEVTLAPGVILPEELGVNFTARKAPEPKNWQELDKNQLALAPTISIHTNDADVTLSQIASNIVIDVSEIEPSVLLRAIDGEFDKITKKFSFTEKTGALLMGLEQGKTVVLKGQFSNDIRYPLAEFLFHRQHENKLQGQLILVNDKPHLFPLVTSYTHTVSEVDKENILSQEAMYKDFVSQGHNTTQFKARPLVEQQAILRSFNAHSDDQKFDPNTCWHGLESLPRTTIPSDIDLTHAAGETERFNQTRKQAIEAILHDSPFVFLAGMTGVGKTTFVQKVWKDEGPLHEGISNIKAWAEDRSPGIKTLFIDEANISSRHWTEFEGLFNNPPGILIGNEYIELTPQHKVIFAGNPLSYGGERQLPALFKRHGNSVVFEPMTPTYIYHEVLQPILASSGFQSKAEQIAKPILEVTQFLTQCSQNEVLITARELGMMALLTATYCQKNPDANPEKVAQYYRYQLSRQFVPEAYKAQFEKAFKGKLLDRDLNKHPGFLNTKSNEVAFNAVSDFIALRELRLAGKVPQDSGLGGLILEGEPGIGKTSLVFKTLVANGLEKGNPAVDNGGKAIFYDMPMSMSISAKEALLRKAFDEGAVVVIDEINSGAMLEGLLNALLMGKTPEGKLPTHPGFMIMGTQNPVTKAGRVRATKALEHRMQKVVVPEYTRPEMKDILIHKGLKEAVVSDILDDYQNRRLAELNDPSIPSICFRDVITLADELLEAEKRKENIELAPEQLSQSEKPLTFAFKRKKSTGEEDKDNQVRPKYE